MCFAPLRSKLSRRLATDFALLAGLVAGAALPSPEDRSGPVTPHIAGGKDSAADDAFVVALLEAGGEDPNEAHYCGGTLIHPRWVLTAAHCVEGIFPSHLEVLVGSRRLDDPNPRILPVLEIRIHPDYNRESLEHDLALLLLPPDAFTTEASGHLLPLLGRSDLEQPGEIARAYGWGVTSEATGEWEVTLQTVELPIVDGSLTENAYGPASTNLIYAGYADGGRNICAGDSGGPLVVHDEAGQPFLAGVVSFSRGDVDCEDPDNYSGFTRVSSYRNWIEGNMRPERTAWESLYGVPADAGDADGDGLSNYAEFAFARNPLVPEKEPLLQVTSVAPLRLEFIGREVPGENEFSARHSTDLVGWAREESYTTSDRQIAGTDAGSSLLRRRWTFPADGAFPAFYQIVAEPRSDFAPILLRLEGHAHLRGVLHPELRRSPFFAGEHPAQSFSVRNDRGETAALRLILDSSQITPVLTNEPDPLDPSAPFAKITPWPQTHGPGGWDLTLPPGTGRWFEVSSAEGLPGEYHLVLFSPPRFNGQLPDGGTLEGELRSTDPAFTFAAEESALPHHLLGLSNWSAPGLYSVRMRSPGLDGFLELIDFGEEAATVASDDGFDTGLDPYLDVYLPSLIAREYLGLRLFSIGSNPLGPYHLTVEKLPRLSVGETLAGDLAPTDPLDPDYARSYYRDDYELVGPESRSSVRLRMRPDEFDAVLVVLDPATDKQIGYIDQGWAAEEEVLELPTEPGRLYRLRATSYGERETGSYTIRAE